MSESTDLSVSEFGFASSRRVFATNMFVTRACSGSYIPIAKTLQLYNEYRSHCE